MPPLRGVPLSTATGLRLLVANDPAPFVLDVDRGTARPVTGLPSDVALKFTSMNWTGDGRLVFLAQTADLGNVVAVWRPGQPLIAVRQVELPKRSGGSDSFVVW